MWELMAALILGGAGIAGTWAAFGEKIADWWKCRERRMTVAEARKHVEAVGANEEIARLWVRLNSDEKKLDRLSTLYAEATESRHQIRGELNNAVIRQAKSDKKMEALQCRLELCENRWRDRELGENAPPKVQT